MTAKQLTERELMLAFLEGLTLVGNMVVSLSDVVKQQAAGVDELIGAFRELLVALGEAS